MVTRDQWLAQQLKALEAHVGAERQRRHEEKRREALRALIMQSLPELLGEIDAHDQVDCEPLAKTGLH